MKPEYMRELSNLVRLSLKCGLLELLLVVVMHGQYLNFQVGSAPAPNIPLTTITICDPNPILMKCQSVNNILVDSGSTGLRVIAQALSIQLPALVQSGGAPIAECVEFGSGGVWGSVNKASIKLEPYLQGGAPTIPVQIIDPSFGSAPPPQPCNAGLFSLADFGMNGILGIAPVQFDMDDGASYFTCQSGGCASTNVLQAQSVQNPIFLLPRDNNGVLLTLAGVPSGGAPMSAGRLFFGIGTAPFNKPEIISGGKPYGSIQANSSYGFITNYKGDDLFPTTLDSGSNKLLFVDSSIPRCRNKIPFADDVYCPNPTPTALSAEVFGAHGPSQSFAFEIANGNDLEYLESLGNYAFDDLAEPVNLPGFDFDWGLPFFYNRVIFIAYGQTPLGNAPAWGYAYLSQPFDGVAVTLTTGNDDAGSGTEITGQLSVEGQLIDICLKPTTSTDSWVDPVCNGSTEANSWSNWHVSTLPASPTVFAQNLASGSPTIDIKLLQNSCQTFCDNWNLQGVIVTLTDSTNNTPPQTILNMSNPSNIGDNCIARLKASPNATTVRFSLDGSNKHVYVDGTNAEQGVTTTCKNNGDGGPPPRSHGGGAVALLTLVGLVIVWEAICGRNYTKRFEIDLHLAHLRLHFPGGTKARRLSYGFQSRVALAVLFALVAHLLSWEWLRVLTSEAVLRISALLGMATSRQSFDIIAIQGEFFQFVTACTFVDVFFGCIPLIWQRERSLRKNLLRVLVAAAVLFVFNIVRLEIGQVLYSRGILSYTWADEVLGGCAYWLVWVALRTQRSWCFTKAADLRATEICQI